MKLVPIALCGLIAAAFLSTAQAQDCGLKRFAALDMLGDPRDSVVVAVTMDGTDRKMLIDTGGIYPGISQKAVAELKLKQTGLAPEMEIYTAGGKKITDYATVPELQIGSNKVRNLRLMVQPEGMLTEQLDGILSPDFLSQFDLDFDFAAKKLNLFSPDHCEGKVVYWAPAYAVIPFKIDAGHIEVDVTLDGKDVKAVVDTGATRSAISSSATKKLFDFDPATETAQKASASDSDLTNETDHRFQQLTIGGVTVSNPAFRVYEDKAEKAYWQQHTDMIDRDPLYGREGLVMAPITLGLNVLSKLHVYIAFKEHKIYVTPADAAWPAKASQ